MVETREDDVIIQFTFGLDEPEAEDEERLKFAKKLLPKLRQLDEVERVDRAENLNPEAGSKAGFGTLLGILTAKVSLKNFKGFLEFLVSSIQDKRIKGSIKVGNNEVEVKFEVKSSQELAELEKTALNLIAAMSGGNYVKEGSTSDWGK
jgi:hypothetical protein